MKVYVIYFEFQGKKYKYKVTASNKQEANKKALAEIINKIVIIDIKQEQDESIEFLKNLFNL
jgi:DNA-binding NarL/FixJ family response regulator